MMWQRSHRAEARAREVADRHYNRQKVGSRQFVPPGRCLVLYAETATGRAAWVTSWPFGEFVKHRWPGAWVCSLFRNEGAGLASSMIRDALAATRSYYGEAPQLGLVTFVDPDKVRPTMVRGKPVWGWTWLKAGFEADGETEGGLLAFRMRPERMPPPSPALESSLAAPLFFGGVFIPAYAPSPDRARPAPAVCVQAAP